jgi:hypothetical protein
MNENLNFKKYQINKKFCKDKKRFNLADFFSCLLKKTYGFFSFILGNAKLLIIIFLIGLFALALPFLNLPFLSFLNFKKYKIVEDKIQHADVVSWLQSNKVEITIYKTNEVFINRFATNIIIREEARPTRPKAVYIDEWKRYNPLD